MKTIIKLLIVTGGIMLMAFNCTREETLPENQAEGTIIQTFRACYGYWVMIEVSNPQGIGKSGTYSLSPGGDSIITYENAIGVPYFERISELETDAPDTVGVWLRFEYRALTDQERNSNIFVDTSFHGICNAMLGPPEANMYMITKVIDYH